MANAYTYNPPFTAEELRSAYHDEGLTQQEIAERYGTTQKVVWRAMAKCGIPSRRAVPRNQKGENNNNWRGGRVLSALKAKPKKDRLHFGNGYYYRLAPDHPNATKQGYVAEHILIATQEAGRPLKKGEVVHHIDMDKHNNEPANLCVCSRKRHAEYHNQLELIACQLLHAGLVSFSPETGYEVSDDCRQFIQRSGRS